MERDDLPDLVGQRLHGAAQPFAVQGARCGEIRPQVVEIGKPIPKGLAIVEGRVKGQRSRAP
jgi:hypothetical protein